MTMMRDQLHAEESFPFLEFSLGREGVMICVMLQ